MRVGKVQDKSDVFRKLAEDDKDKIRLARELTILRHLSESYYVPQIKLHTGYSIETDFIEGESLSDWLQLNTVNWRATKHSMKNAIKRIAQYVEMESYLLEASVMYRDMNLSHVIFCEDRARVVDLEAAEIKAPNDCTWRITSLRGTWETMAPEEFNAPILTQRSATYRVAVVVHLILAGHLPYRRDAHSKSKSHQFRRIRPLQLGRNLPPKVRKVFNSALQVEQSRRQKTPSSFLATIIKAYSL